MATSKKIEEKYQRILKECQKRPENRTCFDCTGRATANEMHMLMVMGAHSAKLTGYASAVRHEARWL